MNYSTINSLLVAFVTISSIVASRVRSTTEVMLMHTLLLSIDVALFVWYVVLRRVTSVKSLLDQRGSFRRVVHLIHSFGVIGVLIPHITELFRLQTIADISLILPVIFYRLWCSRSTRIEQKVKYEVSWRVRHSRVLSDLIPEFKVTEDILDKRTNLEYRTYVADHRSNVLQPNPVGIKLASDYTFGHFTKDLRNAAYITQPLLIRTPHFSQWNLNIVDAETRVTKAGTITVVDELVSALIADGRQSLVHHDALFFRQRAFLFAGLNIPADIDTQIRDNCAVAAYWATFKYDNAFNANVAPPEEPKPYNWLPLGLLVVYRVIACFFSFNYLFVNVPLVVSVLVGEGALYSSF